MTDTTINRHIHLRPEARPYAYDKLFAAGREAVEAVLRLLEEAVRGVPLLGDRASQQRGRSGYALDDLRASRIAFLSGRRGSGKSTALLSLMRMLDSKHRPREGEHGNPVSISELRQRVVLLEPLDMEPLAKGANLLAGILKRIEVAFENAVLGASRLTDRVRPVESQSTAMQGLRALELDVGISWDGNLVQRGSALDLDAYAHDVMRAEHARLGINMRLTNVLDELARVLTETREYYNPIFVLPVDDFDLSPFRCLELLHLLRMVNVPRLFSVICGDLDVARSVVHMNFCGLMNEIAHERVGSGQAVIPPEQISALGNQLTANALRKLLPPGQRIDLKQLTIDETLGLCADSSSPTLAALLERRKIAETSDDKRTLATMFEDRTYKARDVLAMYPRHATDLLQLASNVPGSALALVHEAARLALAEDGSGEAPIARSGSRYQLRSQYIRVSFETAAGLEIPSRGKRKSEVVLLARDHRAWTGTLVDPQARRARPDRKQSGDMERKQLSDSEMDWLVVYHDLCQLSPNGEVPKSMVPQQVPLISAVWSEADEEIEWRYPRWPTFWEMDRFAGRMAAAIAKEARQEDIPRLWIESIFGAPRNEVIGVLKAHAADGPAHLREWVALLPVWLAPECGVEAAFADTLLENKDLADLWVRNAPRIRRLRSDNLDRFDITLCHRLGGRPQELWDMRRAAASLEVKSRSSVPNEVRTPEDIRRIRMFAERLSSKQPPGRRPTVRALAQLAAIEENEHIARSHPINVFRDGLFRPTPEDTLDTDYLSTFGDDD